MDVFMACVVYFVADVFVFYCDVECRDGEEGLGGDGVVVFGEDAVGDCFVHELFEGADGEDFVVGDDVDHG